MAINTTISRVQYNGNSLTVSFPVTFKFIQNSDIVAELDDGTTVTTWVLDTDYTLSGAGVDTGGTLTATTAPATGETLTIYRQVTLTQESDLVTTGAFNSQTVEDMVDKCVQMIQQLNDGIASSSSGLYLKYPNSEPTTTSNELPSNSTRASKILGFDSGGNPSVVTLSGSGTGDVSGPGTSTANNIPQWDSVSNTLKDGKGLLTSSDTTIDSDANLATVGHIINKLTELAAVTSLPALPETKTVNLFESGTITWNRNDGHNATVSLAGTATISLSNRQPGCYNLYVKKISTAGAIVFPQNTYWAGGTVPSLASTTVNKSAIFSFMCPTGVSLFGAAVSDIQ